MLGHGPSLLELKGKDSCVGAVGRVGLATALGLAHHGVASTIIEPHAGPSEGSKAFVVWGRTLEALDAWGLLGPLVGAGDPRNIIAPVSVESGRPIFSVDFTGLASESATPGVLFLSQSVTEALLRDAAGAHPLVTWLRGEVVEVDQKDTAVAVQVRGAHDSGEQMHAMRARFVVGADGAQSVVRRRQGGQLAGRPIRAEILVVDVALEDDAQLASILVVTRRRGLLAALRLSPGKWRILESRAPLVTVSAGVEDAAPADVPRTTTELEALAHEVFGPRPLSLVWQSQTTLYQRRARHFRLGRRVMLVGDAAHLVSPSGGQGMNQGIQDAENLAWSLAAAVRAQRGGDHGLVDAMLDGYAGERERAADDVARRARLNSHLEFATPPWLRPTAFAAMRLGLANTWCARYLARRLSMRDLRYSGRDAVRLAGGARGGPVGRVMPNVAVAPGHRLFAQTAGGACVVAVACDPPEVPAGVVAVRIERAPRRIRLRRGRVAVIRPDRHIGAVLRAPKADDLARVLAAVCGV